MCADAPSCRCGDPGDLAASAHPRGSLQASGAGTVPGAPHSARTCAPLQAFATPWRVRPHSLPEPSQRSTECAGRARRCEPSATEAVPPPLPSLVGGLCVWELAQWRTRFAANFGGRLRVGVGGTWKAAAAASRHRDRFQLWTSVTPRCPQVGSLPLQGLGSADAVRQTSCTSSEVGAQDRMECGERAACDPCTLRDHQGGARRGEAKERF